MEQYCSYLRKSRADAEAEARGEGETLARHEKMLLAVAKRDRYHISKIYREIVSGEAIAGRRARVVCWGSSYGSGTVSPWGYH